MIPWWTVFGMMPVWMLVAKSKLPLSFLLKAVHQGDADDNLVILFTSGSEKDPKAVQLTHRNIGSNVRDIGKVLTVACWVDVDMLRRAVDAFPADLPREAA